MYFEPKKGLKRNIFSAKTHKCARINDNIVYNLNKIMKSYWAITIDNIVMMNGFILRLAEPKNWRPIVSVVVYCFP